LPPFFLPFSLPLPFFLPPFSPGPGGMVEKREEKVPPTNLTLDLNTAIAPPKTATCRSSCEKN
jgi:hypothetical protein